MNFVISVRGIARLLLCGFLAASAGWTGSAESAGGPATDAQPQADAVPTAFRARVEAVASSMTHFASDAIIRNRLLPEASSWIPGPVQKLAIEQVRLGFALHVLGSNPEALHLLLKDQDPRVRTVALGALFEREDPQDLPFIAASMDDTATTVPDLHEPMSSRPGPPYLFQMERPQTVGSVANAMIRFYLQAAQFSGSSYRQWYEGFGVYPPVSAAMFNAYWAERKGRANCVSWSLVKLERAAPHAAPAQLEFKTDIGAVLAEIRSLPSSERDWTLLFAANDEWVPSAHSIIPDAELLRAAKEIGPDTLMKFLTLKPFTSDPDLRFQDDRADPRRPTFFAVSRFITEHATELLRPQDVDAIRAHTE